MSSSVYTQVKLRRNGRDRTEKVISLPSTFTDLYNFASRHFGEQIEAFYLRDGSRLFDIQNVRNNEVLIAATVEPFKGFHELDLPNQMFISLNVKETSIPCSSDWIKLNVGGTCYTTTRATLTKYPHSMLARMFSNPDEWKNAVDGDGCFLIDRSAQYFEPILNYLRNGVLILNEGVNPKGVLEEAKFFGLTSAIEELESIVQIAEKAQTCISRSEFMRLLMTTSSSDQLRCQGVNLSGADLSYLDLREINFKHADLSMANLRHASMAGCQLLLADLSGACLDDATMEGVQMKRANLEGASMRNCKFECQSNIITNLEGANMKGVTLEGSQMSGVDLRLAILKEANMKNCVLRDAILAGADLENCNLTGADLQGANLRGANVIGTVFLDIVTPLHMVHLM